MLFLYERRHTAKKTVILSLKVILKVFFTLWRRAANSLRKNVGSNRRRCAAHEIARGGAAAAYKTNAAN